MKIAALAIQLGLVGAGLAQTLNYMTAAEHFDKLCRNSVHNHKVLQVNKQDFKIICHRYDVDRVEPAYNGVTDLSSVPIYAPMAIAMEVNTLEQCKSDLANCRTANTGQAPSTTLLSGHSDPENCCAEGQTFNYAGRQWKQYCKRYVRSPGVFVKSFSGKDAPTTYQECLAACDATTGLSKPCNAVDWYQSGNSKACRLANVDPNDTNRQLGSTAARTVAVQVI